MSLAAIIEGASWGAALVFAMLLVGVFLAGFAIGAALGAPRDPGRYQTAADLRRIARNARHHE